MCTWIGDPYCPERLECNDYPNCELDAQTEYPVQNGESGDD